MVKRIKSTVSWTYNISDLNGEKIVVIFYEKELQQQQKKTIKKSLQLKNNKKNGR